MFGHRTLVADVHLCKRVLQLWGCQEGILTAWGVRLYPELLGQLTAGAAMGQVSSGGKGILTA